MIGIGLVGYGYWGPNLARCFADTEGCSLVAVRSGCCRQATVAQSQSSLRMNGRFSGPDRPLYTSLP
jgi:hypothetical protein